MTQLEPAGPQAAMPNGATLSPSAPAEGHDLRPAWRRFVGPGLAIGVGVVVAIALTLSGTLADIDSTLQTMGFDPDRAALLADLMAAALVVATSTLASGAGIVAALAGSAAGGVLFAGTFLSETASAMGQGAAPGTFDPGGWALTLFTLLVVLAATAWAAATLTLIVRRWLEVAVRDASSFLRGDRRPRLLGRAAAAILAFAVLATAVPVFGDMVNYTPDAHMRTGGVSVSSGAGGMGGTGAATGAADGTGGAAAADPQASIVPGTPIASILPSSGGGAGKPAVLRSGAPWAAWAPSGQGAMTRLQLPAPWTGTAHSTVSVDVYTPPGYGSVGRAYPVVYNLPWSATSGWTTSVHVQSTLDSLIDAGTVPATLMVFVSGAGGPYPDSECVNSVDGRETFDSFFVDTVIPYVDGHFRTIRTAAARTVLGFSEGGFCASMFLFRHPDTFSTAVSFSGYYQAGVVSNQTPNAARPFGNNAAARSAYSPLDLAATEPASVRSSMFLVMEADPKEPFYGPQYTAMAAAAHAAGISVALLPSSLGHSWSAPRDLLTSALVLVAERQNALGVFA